jgi:uncharacterized membrane protein
MPQPPKNPHDQKTTMASKLTSALFFLIVGAVILASVAPALERLITALTPMLGVIGFIVIALRLTDFYIRR